jgi:LEA14-like dessication related protein
MEQLIMGKHTIQKAMEKRIENGDTFKRRIDGVEKHRGKDARAVILRINSRNIL